jgi:hypothetical protein
VEPWLLRWTRPPLDRRTRFFSRRWPGLILPEGGEASNGRCLPTSATASKPVQL